MTTLSANAAETTTVSTVEAPPRDQNGSTVASFGLCFFLMGLVLGAGSLTNNMIGLQLALGTIGGGLVMFFTGALMAMPYTRHRLFLALTFRRAQA